MQTAPAEPPCIYLLRRALSTAARWRPRQRATWMDGRLPPRGRFMSLCGDRGFAGAERRCTVSVRASPSRAEQVSGGLRFSLFRGIWSPEVQNCKPRFPPTPRCQGKVACMRRKKKMGLSPVLNRAPLLERGGRSAGPSAQGCF